MCLHRSAVRACHSRRGNLRRSEKPGVPPGLRLLRARPTGIAARYGCHRPNRPSRRCARGRCPCGFSAYSLTAHSHRQPDRRGRGWCDAPRHPPPFRSRPSHTGRSRHRRHPCEPAYPVAVARPCGSGKASDRQGKLSERACLSSSRHRWCQRDAVRESARCRCSAWCSRHACAPSTAGVSVYKSRETCPAPDAGAPHDGASRDGLPTAPYYYIRWRGSQASSCPRSRDGEDIRRA